MEPRQSICFLSANGFLYQNPQTIRSATLVTRSFWRRQEAPSVSVYFLKQHRLPKETRSKISERVVAVACLSCLCGSCWGLGQIVFLLYVQDKTGLTALWSKKKIIIISAFIGRISLHGASSYAIKCGRVLEASWSVQSRCHQLFSLKLSKLVKLVKICQIGQ